MYCLQGQVNLPWIQEWPYVLQELFDDPHDHREFKKKICQYNNTLAFTSVGSAMDNDAIQGSGPASFRIHGALHHLMGALIPPDGLEASYAQLYIYYPQEATDRHVQHNPQLNGAILLDLHNTLRERHPYAPLYKQAYEIMRVSGHYLLQIKSTHCNVIQAKPPEEHTDVCVRLHLQQDADARRYNLPTVKEIAAVVPDDGSQHVRADCDIVVRLQGGGLRHISNLHPSYPSLHYVLFFPHGEEGWHLNTPLQDAHRNPQRSKKVTQLLWYAYRLHIRPSQTEPQNIFKGGRLFQLLVCDAWASIDQSNLTWAANNQTRLKADLYQGLRDHMGHDGHQDMNQVGRVILPSTHKGGTRYMQQLLQDSLAICHEYRKPDLFLTMTANGSWPEITQNLFPGVYISIFHFLSRSDHLSDHPS